MPVMIAQGEVTRVSQRHRAAIKPNKKRANVVILTKKIDPKLKRLEGLVKEIGLEATRGLTENERDMFLASLKRVHSNMKGLTEKKPDFTDQDVSVGL